MYTSDNSFVGEILMEKIVLLPPNMNKVVRTNLQGLLLHTDKLQQHSHLQSQGKLPIRMAKEQVVQCRGNLTIMVTADQEGTVLTGVMRADQEGTVVTAVMRTDQEGTVVTAVMRADPGHTVARAAMKADRGLMVAVTEVPVVVGLALSLGKDSRREGKGEDEDRDRFQMIRS